MAVTDKTQEMKRMRAKMLSLQRKADAVRVKYLNLRHAERLAEVGGNLSFLRSLRYELDVIGFVQGEERRFYGENIYFKASATAALIRDYFGPDYFGLGNYQAEISMVSYVPLPAFEECYSKRYQAIRNEEHRDSAYDGSGNEPEARYQIIWPDERIVAARDEAKVVVRLNFIKLQDAINYIQAKDIKFNVNSGLEKIADELESDAKRIRQALDTCIAV